MSDRWFEAFQRDPQMAVADLFTGRAGVGSSLRLDVPELLRLRFPPSLVEERAQLDDALLSWLLEMRKSYASRVERLGFLVYGKRVGDALIALQLLNLPQARDEIRKNMDAWLRWLSPLRLAPERDPALECLRLLTQGQPDTRHTATWLRLAVDRRAEYLTVALAGLQLLPNGGDARKNQVLMLQALLRHATTTFHEVNGALRFFNRRFGALRGLYPRGPQHWHDVLDEALPRFQRQVPTPLANSLAGELWKRQPAKRLKSLRSRHSVPAPEREWKALLSDIRNPSKQPEELAQRLFNILERNDDYAVATGNSYPFVRTLCNLGREMLENHGLIKSDMDQLGAMIERAFVWEPVNPYCWMLWAQWFQAQGQSDAQEAVLREMLRMFPRDLPSHVELARLLIRDGEENWPEAEHYLRRAMVQDPTDSHAHVVMARLLRLRGKLDAAEKTLEGFLILNPDNPEVKDSLEKLKAGLPTSYSPRDDDPRSAAQDGPREETPLATASGLQEILRRGSLAGEFSRARIANGNAVQTTRIRQESRQGDSLAGFYSQWLKLHDTPGCPPNAWAWDACLHWQRAAAPEDWRYLAERFPEAAAETDFLRSLICPDSPDRESWRDHYRTGKGAQARAVDRLMCEMSKTWEQLANVDNADQRERDEVACALMACAAADTLKFAAGAY